MKNILENQDDRALSKKEIILFKYLNKHRNEFKKKDQLIEAIKTMLSVFGENPEEALAYYYAYTANFRPDGDYENLTKSEFKDYKTFKQKKISNVESSQFTSSKIPFKGSNLEGYWDVNNKNEWYYVVKSYGWYPIYLFINDKWYQVSDKYSISTSKQIGYSRPSRYSNEFESTIYFVDRKEMEGLMNGRINFDDLMKGKKTSLENTLKRELLGVPKFLSWGYGDGSGKAKFKVSDIKQIDDKVLITIDVLEAGRREGQKLVKSDVSYTTGQIPAATPAKVEYAIKQKINSEYSSIIGQYVDEDEELPQDYFVLYKFNHKE